jgi:hypothetical protein
MVGTFTHVASYAGVFHHGSMCSGFAFSASAGNAHQHTGLWAMVRAPVRGDALDDTIFSSGEATACLVAVGAQVALTTVIGNVLKGIKVYWIRGF